MMKNRLLKDILRYDLYTNHLVLRESRTIEHVIPQKFLSCHSMKSDIYNLSMCSREVNGFRSAYRFGGNVEMIYYEPKNWEYRHGCFRNTRKNLFFPTVNHDIIQKIIKRMMIMYPSLEDLKSEIIIEDHWSLLNKTQDINQQHFQLLLEKKINS